MRSTSRGRCNAYRAARAVGAKRFVYASSVAAYGFHRDNPVGMTEEWPVRPADRLFYAQEKAELEQLLEAETRKTKGGPKLYLLRPPIVLGPHAMGAKGALPDAVAGLGRAALDLIGRLPIPVPALAPGVPLQFIHEADVGSALMLCVLAAGSARRVQHRRRRRAHRRRRGARARPHADQHPFASGPGRGSGRVGDPPSARRLPRGRLGRGDRPPVDHGHRQGEARARLGAAATPGSKHCATRCRSSVCHDFVTRGDRTGSLMPLNRYEPLFRGRLRTTISPPPDGGQHTTETVACGPPSGRRTNGGQI